MFSDEKDKLEIGLKIMEELPKYLDTIEKECIKELYCYLTNVCDDHDSAVNMLDFNVRMKVFNFIKDYIIKYSKQSDEKAHTAALYVVDNLSDFFDTTSLNVKCQIQRQLNEFNKDNS